MYALSLIQHSPLTIAFRPHKEIDPQRSVKHLLSALRNVKQLTAHRFYDFTSFYVY